MKKITIKKSLKENKMVSNDAPNLTKSFLKKAVAMPPITDSNWQKQMDKISKGKKTSAISLDDEVVSWFSEHSKNCQASINHVLRHYILSHEVPR